MDSLGSIERIEAHVARTEEHLCIVEELLREILERLPARLEPPFERLGTR
jgi:hypothetical protein